MDRKTAKLFMNGRSQAVRLPQEFRFEGKEVYITKQGVFKVGGKLQNKSDLFLIKSGSRSLFFL